MQDIKIYDSIFVLINKAPKKAINNKQKKNKKLIILQIKKELNNLYKLFFCFINFCLF